MKEQKKNFFSNSRIFLCSLMAFGGGIFGRLVFEAAGFNPFFSGWWLWGPVFFGLYFYFSRDRRDLALFFVLLAGLVGWGRADGELGKVFIRPEENFVGRALVWDEPEKSGIGMKMKIKWLEGKQEKALFLSNDYLNFQVGDVIRAECFLKNPQKIEDWNYPLNLASQGIYQLCQKGKAERIEVFEKIKTDLTWRDRARLGFLRQSYAWRKKVEEKIYLRLPFPESGFLAGLLLGGDDRLDEGTQEVFRRAGVSHLVAVSGYNISLLGTFLMWAAFLLGFWRSQAFWLALAGIIFFVFSIGSPASAVRAAVMGGLVLYAGKNGRLADSFRVLVLAGAVMLWFSPLMLFYDAGFQLSFLATLSLVSLYASWARKMGVEKDFLELKSILLTTLAAQVGVLGLLVFSFHSLSVVSLLANVLILPLIPWLTLGGFLLVFLEFVWPLGAGIFSAWLWLGLRWEIAVAEFLAGWSWAEIEIEGLGVFWLVGYYLFFWLWVWFSKNSFLLAKKAEKE